MSLQLTLLMNKILALLIGLCCFQLQSQNCPSIEAIMVDACGTEHLNEFVIISSGDNGFEINDLQFGFNSTNTNGATNSNINDGFTSCGLTEGNLSAFEGCNNLIALGPGDDVPENSYLILQTSNNPNTIYDLSDLCGNDACIYVVSNDCTRTIGAFTNKSTGSPGPRSNNLAINGTSCLDNATYNTQDLISSADGNYFIPPNTYGVENPDECVSPPIAPAEGNAPVFDEFEPICVDANNPLPTSSNNGISGEWIPAFNNQETTTYTFIPNQETCGSDVQVTIEVIPNELPEFSIEQEFCANQNDFPELPTLSNNGIEGTWTPEEISEDTTAYLFTPSSSCSEEFSLEISFVPGDDPIFDLPTELCQGTQFVLPNTSENGINGTWSPVFDPQNSAQYTFTPAQEFCATSLTINIEITNQNLSAVEDQIPANIEQNCSQELPEVPEIELSEVCGVAAITFEEIAESGNCPTTETITRNWTVLDADEEVLATYTQIITLVDNQAPFFTVLPSDEILNCDEQWPDDANVQAEDDCSEVSISIEEEIIEDADCSQNFTLIRTFIASDECGNEAEEQQIIEFVDNQGPEFEEDLPTSIQVECGEIPQVIEPEVFDACGEVNSLELTENELDNCEVGKVTERIWKATDNCGNTSTYALALVEECQPVVYQGISPNNDGLNDYLEIEGISCYPVNKLEIYNRYGNNVFSTNNYGQDGNFFKGNDQSGNQLVTGTYFFVFNYKKNTSDSFKDIKGYVYINRSK